MQQHGAADIAKAPTPQEVVKVKGCIILLGSQLPPVSLNDQGSMLQSCELLTSSLT
jgi:hypothetical protein